MHKSFGECVTVLVRRFNIWESISCDAVDTVPFFVAGHLTAASSKSILMRYVRVSCVLHRLESSAPFILALMLISWIIADLKKKLEFKWLPFEIFVVAAINFQVNPTVTIIWDKVFDRRRILHIRNTFFSLHFIAMFWWLRENKNSAGIDWTKSNGRRWGKGRNQVKAIDDTLSFRFGWTVWV